MSLRVYVFSDNRLPTQSVGGHGLGRLAHLTAEVLLDLGFTVTIWGSPGTEPALSNRKWSAVRTYQFEDEARESIRADLRARVVDFVIDMTHEHVLGKTDFDLPILHYIVDTECAYKPPNAVVCNAWQAQFFPGARILMPPVNDKMISFYSAPAEPLYLAYAAKIDHRKGYDIALEIHRRQSIPVHFVGDGVALENEPVFWRRELLGREFYDFIGLAGVLLSPSRLDAGGLVNLEAGACGTPVLVLENTGPAAYVEHGVTGFHCKDADDMIRRIPDALALDRRAIRVHVMRRHARWRFAHDLLGLLYHLMPEVWLRARNDDSSGYRGW